MLPPRASTGRGCRSRREGSRPAEGGVGRGAVAAAEGSEAEPAAAAAAVAEEATAEEEEEAEMPRAMLQVREAFAAPVAGGGLAGGSARRETIHTLSTSSARWCGLTLTLTLTINPNPNPNTNPNPNPNPNPNSNPNTNVP